MSPVNEGETCVSPACIDQSIPFRSFRPNCNNTLFNAWDSLLNETESDATAHTDIAGVFGRAVSRPLLEKTFHMKIQSRTVFLHRESFETILDKTEQMLLKVSIIIHIQSTFPLIYFKGSYSICSHFSHII